jgi:hypothetical protein
MCSQPSLRMRTLIYKRTHPGDPNPRGHFGSEDCMGRVRSWEFDAVIGVGGVGSESSSHGLDGKINWIGIGAHKHPRPSGRGPLVAFDSFVLFENKGPDFATVAPRLARRLFEDNVRVLLHDIDEEEKREIQRILQMAVGAEPSARLTPQAVTSYCRDRHRSRCSCRKCSNGRSQRRGGSGC